MMCADSSSRPLHCWTLAWLLHTPPSVFLSLHLHLNLSVMPANHFPQVVAHLPRLSILALSHTNLDLPTT